MKGNNNGTRYRRHKQVSNPPNPTADNFRDNVPGTSSAQRCSGTDDSTQSPEDDSIEVDAENASLSYGFEAVIPSDTTGRAEDIQIISMSYQLKTSE